VTGAVVVIAEAIRWPVAVLMLWLSGATLAAADRVRAGNLALGLLRVADVCARIARQMLHGGAEHMSDKKGGMLAVVEVKGDPNYWVPCVAYPIGGSLVEVRIDGKPVQNCIDGRLFLDSDIYLDGDHFSRIPKNS
jgi:hypothetical protein